MPNCSAVKEEFCGRNLTFQYDQKDDFLQSSCSYIPQSVFLSYRMLLLVGLGVFTVFDFLYIIHELNYKVSFWFLFPSNWALLFLCALHLYWTGLVAGGYCCSKLVFHGTSILWLLHVIALDFILLTTEFYWVAVYTQSAYPEEGIHGPYSVQNYAFHIMHSVPLCVVLLDQIVCSVPVRMAHLLYSIVATLIYVLFSLAVHHMADEDLRVSMTQVAFPRVDWMETENGVLSACLVMVMVAFWHCFLYFIHVTKLFFRDSCAKRDAEWYDE